jgi:flagellin
MHLSNAESALSRSLNRLSSGKKINNAGDDVGGLSVAYQPQTKLSRNTQVVNNLSNATSFLNVQEGALQNVGSILSRMAELKTMSLDVSKNRNDAENYDKEFRELQLQLSQISRMKHNGVSLFSDQIPKNLFGEAQGLEVLNQTSDDDDFTQTAKITRWGIRRFLSQTLEAGDKTPTGFGENPPREYLSMVFTNESLMDTDSTGAPGGSLDGWKRSYHEHDNADEEAIWVTDNNDWVGFLGDNNYSAKIEAISNFSDAIFPDSFDPSGLSALSYTGAAIEFFRDISTDGLMLKKDGGTTASQLANYQNAFHKLTNNGTELPGALVLNVDNSQSMGGFKELNEGVLAFKEWVETTYPQVFVPNQTSDNFQEYLDPLTSMQNGVSIGSNENGYFLGIRINEGEDYIRQGRLAIEDAVSEYTGVTGGEIIGTLDDDASGLKSLLDGAYHLEDFDISEFESFIQSLSGALAVNGAESQAVDFAIQKLQKTYDNSEQAFGRIVDTDVAIETTRLARPNVLLQASASMLSQANELSGVALPLLA